MKINIKKVLYFIIGKEYKEESPPYPSHFVIINYSPIALKENIRDEQNKLIYEYSADEIGRLVVKKYRYSKARIISLREVKKIPIYDTPAASVRAMHAMVSYAKYAGASNSSA